jgi:hypothetical protein
MKLILTMFYLTPYIQNISTYNQHEILLIRYCTLSYCLQNQYAFYTDITTQCGGTTFPVLKSHTRSAATAGFYSARRGQTCPPFFPPHNLDL